MCEAAFSRGFESIGFSSHAPIVKKTGIKTEWHMKDERLNEYIDEVLKARKKWKGKLEIFLGLEVDYIRGLCGPMDADIQALPLDYIIGAVHFCCMPKSHEFFSVDGSPEELEKGLEQFDNDEDALCEEYYDTYCSMINAGGSDILAHLDIIKKNNNRLLFFSPKDSWYTKLLIRTADIIAAVRASNKNTGGSMLVVEVNTGAMNNGYCSEPYPSLDVLKFLVERNIPLVINADAHTPDHLGGNYEAAVTVMKEAGYTAALLFEGCREGKAVWREEPLAK
jgi:histidinol-phosphatase (PHP family)